MKSFKISVITLLVSFLLLMSFSTQAVVLRAMKNQMRFHQWIFTFYLSGPVNYRAFWLKNPDRFVLDLKNVKDETRLSYKPLIGTPIRSLHYAAHQDNVFRVAFELRQKATAQVVSLPNSRDGEHRLRVIFTRPGQHVAAFDWPFEQKADTDSVKKQVLSHNQKKTLPTVML